jgi:hypothetical protein
VSVKVGVFDSYPPGAAPDLAASPTVTPGQVVLTWTAPDEDNFVFSTTGPVTSYTVGYSTYSIASLLGNDALWWAQAQTLGSVPVPQGPGSAEIMAGALLPGTTYYFALKSVDDQGNVSPIDVNALGAQATVVTRRDPVDTLPPGLAGGVLVADDGSGVFTAQWPAVTLNSDGSPMTDRAGYRVYRSTAPEGTPTLVASSTLAVPGAFSFGASATDRYYRLVAVDAAGNESPLVGSNFLRITSVGVVTLAASAWDGTAALAEIPAASLPEFNATGARLLLFGRSSDPAPVADTGRTLATYAVGFSAPGGIVSDPSFHFGGPVVAVALAYDAPGAAPDKAVGVLWWNGVRWTRLGQGEKDTATKTVTVRTALPGSYQVRLYTAATELTLDAANVFPKIFSPNGDGINDVVLFLIENPRLSSLDGRVFDVTRAEVGVLKPAGAGAPSPDTLMWDGRDRSGAVVPPGVYIYQIKGEGKTLTGSVVVAR